MVKKDRINFSGENLSGIFIVVEFKWNKKWVKKPAMVALWSMAPSQIQVERMP